MEGSVVAFVAGVREPDLFQQFAALKIPFALALGCPSQPQEY